jgi:osmotically inducible protein OsmC
MVEIIRRAGAVWQGNLRKGSGRIRTESGVLAETPYGFSTRFENEPGTNPEELIAAAHAACYSMAFANTLAQKGYDPQSIDTSAEITFERQNGGFAIVKSTLRVRGQVPDLDAETFEQIAHEADKNCPVSKLLRPGLRKIEIETELL